MKKRREKKRQRRPTRAWERGQGPQSQARAVLEALKRPRLAMLEDCRVAWERDHDPFALLVAIRKAELPTWLVDGLSTAIRDVDLMRNLWARFHRDERDLIRAFFVAFTRTHGDDPKTWAEAYRAAARLVERDQKVVLSPDAMQRSYRRVVRMIKTEPWRATTGPTRTT